MSWSPWAQSAFTTQDTLKPIQAVRTRAVTFMESNGVSLYGGKIWLVPTEKLGEVQSLLSDFAIYV